MKRKFLPPVPDLAPVVLPVPAPPAMDPEAEAKQRCISRIILAAAAAVLSPDPAAAVAMAERVVIGFAGSLAPPMADFGFATAATSGDRERRAAQLFALIGTLIGDLDSYGVGLDRLESLVSGK